MAGARADTRGAVEPPDASPLELAEELSRLDVPEWAARFRLLSKDRAAEVFDALDAARQRDLLEGLRAAEVVGLVEAMAPDDRVRLLDEMPAGVARRLVAGLSDEERRLTHVLLGYPPESAGRLMTPQYLELRPEATVDEALVKIRGEGEGLETLNVLPVRGPDRHLEGVVRLPDLVRAQPDVPISASWIVGIRRSARTTTRSWWRG